MPAVQGGPGKDDVVCDRDPSSMSSYLMALQEPGRPRGDVDGVLSVVRCGLGRCLAQRRVTEGEETWQGPVLSKCMCLYLSGADRNRQDGGCLERSGRGIKR